MVDVAAFKAEVSANPLAKFRCPDGVPRRYLDCRFFRCAPTADDYSQWNEEAEITQADLMNPEYYDGTVHYCPPDRPFA